MSEKQRHGYATELLHLVKLMWPICSIQCLDQFVYTIVAMHMGFFGKEVIDGMALGTSTSNVFGYSLAWGVNSAFDTLFSQINGSKNRHFLDTVLQKAIVINILVWIVCASILVNIDWLLIATGQDNVISRFAGQFTVTYCPGILLHLMIMLLLKYLSCQSIIMPALVIHFVMNIANVFFMKLFIDCFKLSVVGAGLTFNMTELLGLTMYVMYIYAFKGNWKSWSVSCLLDWGEVFRLGGYGVVMHSAAWWLQEAMFILVGLLGPTQLAAHYIAFRIISTTDMIAFGCNTAINVRVGNLIGGGDHVTAKKAAVVSYFASGAVGVLISSAFYLNGNYIAHIFTDKSDVISMFIPLIPVMTLYIPFNIIRDIEGAILSAIGRQRFGAFSGLVVVYGISLPLGVYLMFYTSLGVLGTWLALGLSEVIRAVIFFIRILCIDWREEARLAAIRTKVKGTTLRSSGVYQPLTQDESEDSDDELTDPVEEKGFQETMSDRRHLRHVLIKRSVTFLFAVILFGLGITSYFVRNTGQIVDIPFNNTNIITCDNTSVVQLDFSNDIV